MKLLTRKKTPAEQLKNAAIEAALSALGGDKSKDKPALTRVPAVATGAVLYTAGRAAFTRRRFLREQFSFNQTAPDSAGEPSTKTVTPPARRKDPQPSLDLPQQRWPRISAVRN